MACSRLLLLLLLSLLVLQRCLGRSMPRLPLQLRPGQCVQTVLERGLSLLELRMALLP